MPKWASNEPPGGSVLARDVLRDLLGGLAYAVIKPLLRDVKIKIYPVQKIVEVNKGGRITVVPFADIEQVINDEP